MADSPNSSPFDDQALAREFHYLARLIFCIDPKPGLAENYAKANAIVFLGADTGRIQKLMGEAIDRKCDLEALEIASRMKNKSNFLTQKIQILFYLMETQPDYFSLFVNRKGSAFKAYLLLCFQTSRSLYKLIKGALLLKRSPWREFIRQEARS